MNTSINIHQNAKRRHTKVLPALGKAFLFVLPIAGLFYLWDLSVIPLYVKTSLLTILGGAFVVVVGQVIQKWYIEPIQELQKTIGEVGSAVLVYANTADQRIEADLQKEASRALRQLSGDLLGKRRVVAHYEFFEKLGILPSRNNISEAVSGLVLMSNSVGSHSFDSFDKGTASKQPFGWTSEKLCRKFGKPDGLTMRCTGQTLPLFRVRWRRSGAGSICR